jgi:hypothetical protein
VLSANALHVIPNHPELVDYYRQFDSMTIIDGVVYRAYIDERGGVKFYQLVTPFKLRSQVIELAHDVVKCHAKPWDKNVKCLQQYVFWPRWKQHLCLALKSCRPYLETHCGPLPKQGRLSPNVSKTTSPNQVLSIDLVGKLLPSGSSRYEYLCVGQGEFTKFLYLAHCQMKLLSRQPRPLCRFAYTEDIPHTLRNDNGKEFVSSLHDELYKVTGSRHLVTIPYCSRMNSL